MVFLGIKFGVVALISGFVGFLFGLVSRLLVEQYKHFLGKKRDKIERLRSILIDQGIESCIIFLREIPDRKINNKLKEAPVKLEELRKFSLNNFDKISHVFSKESCQRFKEIYRIINYSDPPFEKRQVDVLEVNTGKAIKELNDWRKIFENNPDIGQLKLFLLKLWFKYRALK